MHIVREWVHRGCAIRAARNQRRDFVGDGKLLFNDACDMAKRCVGAPQFIRIFDMNLAFAVIPRRAVFRIPGNTAVKSAGVSAASADTEAITRYGATRTPQSAMKHFSAARSCAIARQCAPGRTQAMRARNSKQRAGIFSNSVEMAAHRWPNSTNAASSS